MIGNHTIADDLFGAIFVRIAQQFLHTSHRWQEKVGVIIAGSVLQNAYQSLQTQSCVDGWVGQWCGNTFFVGVVLHENEIPDFEELFVGIVVVVEQADVDVVEVALIVVDFGAGAVGSSVTHRPIVVGFAEPFDFVGGEIFFP